MARALNQFEARLRPRLVQGPGGFGGAGHVVAAMNDDAGNVGQYSGIGDQLTIVQPAAMREIMIFDPCEGEREIIRVMHRRQRRVG